MTIHTGKRKQQFLFSVKRLLGLLPSLNRTPEWDEMSLMRWNAFGFFFVMVSEVIWMRV